jgi:glycolate oxidase
VGRISPDYIVQDGVIPRTALPAVLREIEELSQQYGLRVANVFHAGDGNLHPLVCYDHRDEGAEARAEELAGEIIHRCVEHGGSITGEHGVGMDKRHHMPAMFTEADMATHQLIRCAFNPANLCNPGKVYPTPRLCGETPGRYEPHPLETAGLAERF